MDYADGSYDIGTGFSNVESDGGYRGEPALSGNVTTPHGIVEVYAQDEYSSLEFFHEGRIATRTFDHYLCKITLVRQAYKFAREIVGHGRKAASEWTVTHNACGYEAQTDFNGRYSCNCTGAE